MNPAVIRKLESLGACPAAIDWLATQPSIAVAWCECQRGDWMAWLLGRLSGEPESAKRKRLCLCLAAIADSVPQGSAGKRCLRTLRAWAHGKATIEQVRAAAYAAGAAAAADADAAAYAADAAADAADAAAYGSDAAARARCADIVRKHYPTPPRLP